MPRRSEKSYIEQALSHALMTEMLYYALNETDTNDGDWEDLALILARVRSMRYLQRRSLGSAGRVLYTQHFDMIDQYLEFPDEGFRARFRMTREEFDDVIALLQANSTEEEWHTNNNSGRGCPGRSMAKQVALALSVLGGQEETLEKVRATFGIAKGSVYNYLWRFITVVCRLVTRLIQFPTKEKQRIKQQECDANDLFIGCIGYIDGSDIVLNEKPQRDWDMYYGRKSVYGFNLQAVCDDDYIITYAQLRHRVSAHDSTAFKASSLYRHRESLFDENAYLLGDKAYEIDKHVLTPFRQNASHTDIPFQTVYNVALSNRRIHIEHTFGQLKERFSSVYSLPTHIREGLLSYDLNRVQHWVLTCICIHNFLRMRSIGRAVPDSRVSSDALLSRPSSFHTSYAMRTADEHRRVEIAERVYNIIMERAAEN